MLLLLVYACLKRKVFSGRLKVLVSVSPCSVIADCSKLLILHTKMNVLQTSDAFAAVRYVDWRWSADEDAK